MSAAVPVQTAKAASNIAERIYEFFPRSAAAFPDKIAVESGGVQYTYRELDRFSGRLGQGLLGILGAEPRPVALLLEEGADVVAAVLGVLRAGSFYTVLSPRSPIERMHRIMQDLNPAVLLTCPALLGKAREAAPAGCQVISLEEARAWPDSDAWQRLPPEAVAAVYYTSGSTGEPKGVAQPLSIIEQRARIQVKQHKLQADDRVLVTLSISATASLSATFGTLAAGASLYVFDAERQGVAPLKDLIWQNEITYLRWPIELLRFFLDSLPAEATFPSVRRIGAGGDTMYYRDVERLRRHFRPDVWFITQYSMSEFGALSSNSFSLDQPVQQGKVPAGRPVPGRSFVILGEDGTPLPEGETGEIALRTTIPFGGYWKRPDLTAEITIPDPADPARLIYRTGDFGRIRADGQLELAGRRDQRAKIRGFTVDMSAVESELMAIPGVRRAAVFAHQEPSGRKRLVAYVHPAQGFQVSGRHLRRELSRKLPDHMVPSLFVALAELPLTRTGKIDRQALPVPRWDHPERSAPYVAPRDELERRLEGMWQEVLHLDAVGIDDDFFDLGGDSLMAASLMAALEKAYGRTLPVTVMLKAPTVRSQADLLRANDVADDEPILIPIRTAGGKPPLFCFGGKGGTPLRFNRLLAHLHEELPVYYLRSRGLRPGERTSDFLEEIVADYLSQIREVQPHGPFNFLGESGGGMVAYEMARQLTAQGEPVGFVGMLDTYLPEFRKPSTYWLLLLRKHLQTLSSGGLRGLRVYAAYYAGLLRYKLYRFQGWGRKNWIRLTHPGLLERYDRLEAANLRAGRAYRPKPYGQTVHLFSAALQARYEGTSPNNGWDSVPVGKLIVHALDCYHGNILFEPFVSQVAEVLNQSLTA